MRYIGTFGNSIMLNSIFDSFNAVLRKIDSTKSLILAVGLHCALITPSHAHEFWIEPLSHRVAMGEKVEAHLRNGQYFEGRPCLISRAISGL